MSRAHVPERIALVAALALIAFAAAVAYLNFRDEDGKDRVAIEGNKHEVILRFLDKKGKAVEIKP